MDMGSLASRGGVGTTVPVARTNEIEAATATREVVEARKKDSMADTELNREQVLAAVTDMQDYVDAAGRNIQFQLDDGSGRMVVKVTEASTGDVIRQMPSEEALRLAENLAEMSGLLFSGEA